MTFNKALERFSNYEGEKRILIKLFKELSEALNEWNNATDKLREEEAKNKYRKVSNSILSITNNSQYKLCINDVVSCNREVVAYPQKEAKRSFKFRF